MPVRPYFLSCDFRCCRLKREAEEGGVWLGVASVMVPPVLRWGAGAGTGCPGEVGRGRARWGGLQAACIMSCQVGQCEEVVDWNACGQAFVRAPLPLPPRLLGVLPGG